MGPLSRKVPREICRALSSFCKRQISNGASSSGPKTTAGSCNSVSKFATFTQPKVSTSTLKDKPIHQIPLSESVPFHEKVTYASPPTTDPFETQITTLADGIRVVTAPNFGDCCTIGVVINAGTRYEVAYPSGINHFLEKLAFNSTERYETSQDIFGAIEPHASIVDAQGTKDVFIYAASCTIKGADDVLEVLADAALRPRITEDEIENARQVITFDNEDMASRPDCTPLLTDWIHEAAYRGNTLGLPKFCPAENLEKINRNVLFSFLRSYFTPKRMVVAGIGVPHELLVESTQRHFCDNPPVWTKDASLGTVAQDDSIAQYTGGIIKKERDLSVIGAGTPYPELAHLVLGLESCSCVDDDFVAFCVLNALMGGGSSFSAGGPGKGMYTRLYTHVLQQHHKMFEATCYHHSYTDSGLFCISASAPPKEQSPRQVAGVILNEFLKMAGPFSAEEVSRAKKQLQSNLMMNLETRPVQFEDVGRSVLAIGERPSPLYYVEQIEKVSEKDLIRVAERMLAGRASVVGYGDLSDFPEYDDIDQALARRDLSRIIPKKSYSFLGRNS